MTHAHKYNVKLLIVVFAMMQLLNVLTKLEEDILLMLVIFALCMAQRHQQIKASDGLKYYLFASSFPFD